ncbi:hypothetical protein BDN70DRAFT_892636 [Pholiota conissans]|uniref:Uncharacterized protein n=1 Tax=Pholiota conissans TaxID=109636 RepID=A0A9P6CVX5_9AGAR|nr:hypothetical protein BDN70DRAFT_892636 [Pholiota conissans]
MGDGEVGMLRWEMESENHTNDMEDGLSVEKDGLIGGNLDACKMLLEGEGEARSEEIEEGLRRAGSSGNASAMKPCLEATYMRAVGMDEVDEVESITPKVVAGAKEAPKEEERGPSNGNEDPPSSNADVGTAPAVPANLPFRLNPPGLSLPIPASRQTRSGSRMAAQTAAMLESDQFSESESELSELEDD